MVISTQPSWNFLWLYKQFTLLKINTLGKTIWDKINLLLIIIYSLIECIFPVPLKASGYVKLVVLSYLVGGFICQCCYTVERRSSHEAQMQVDNEFWHLGSIWNVVVVSGYLDRRWKPEIFFSARIRSLREGNVFSCVCEPVHEWGWGGRWSLSHNAIPLPRSGLTLENFWF